MGIFLVMRWEFWSIPTQK